MTPSDALLDAPVVLAVVAGLALLARSHARARRATAFGVVSLCVLAALFGALRVHHLFVPDLVHPSVVIVGYRVVLGACILLLVIGVVADRDVRPAARLPAEDD